MRRILALSTLVAAIVVPSVAFAKPLVTVKLSQLTVTKGADGKLVESPSSDVKPGDVLKYRIVAANAGTTPALAFSPADKIPSGTTFIAGSATGKALRVEYSIDGGKTWSSAPLVKIVAKDGTTTEKPASPATFTAIRWITADPLAAKAASEFTFEVRVK